MSAVGTAMTAALTSQAQTQQSIGIALQKQAHQADQAVVAVIQEVLQSAPPPGTGTKVDLKV